MRQIVWIYHQLEWHALAYSISNFGSEHSLMESELSCAMRRACSIRAETKIEFGENGTGENPCKLLSLTTKDVPHRFLRRQLCALSLLLEKMNNASD